MHSVALVDSHGVGGLHVAVAAITVHRDGVLVDGSHLSAAHRRQAGDGHHHVVVGRHAGEVELASGDIDLCAVNLDGRDGIAGILSDRPGNLRVLAVLHRLGGAERHHVLRSGALDPGRDGEMGVDRYRRLGLLGNIRFDDRVLGKDHGNLDVLG